eukprot:TRINITY_DN80775_c0_g1_i1.p1 TRINITY_DN80775_c0_g1~~TRINITY_DN80775_c0_g1_i1.p1  ORF type:complete len:503 (-),score=88.66 TRINITY_DN80775_c0_g1_i1:55-1563(-)
MTSESVSCAFDATRLLPEVTIILPVYNAEEFLDEAFESIFRQRFLEEGGRLEVSVFDDGSSDGSAKIIENWQQKLTAAYPETLTFTYGVNSERIEAAKRGEKRAEAYLNEKSCPAMPMEEDGADEIQDEICDIDVKAAPETASSRGSCGLCSEEFPAEELEPKKKKAKPGTPVYCLKCRELSQEQWKAKRSEVYCKRMAASKAPTTSFETETCSNGIEREKKKGVACGIGFACNSAIQQSKGEFMCRFDADDVMHPDRIKLQLAAVRSMPKEDQDRTLVGSGFVRLPADATPRYTQWLNGMSDEQLLSQRFREVTLLHPTWLYHRRIWERVGGYTQDTSVGEDIVYFHKHLESGGRLHRVSDALLTYRCHPGQRSWRLPRRAVQDAKVAAFERQVLASSWQGKSFAVVGAGRDARDFCRSLSTAGRTRVTAFHEVDPKKIGRSIALPGAPGEPIRQIPVLEQAELTLPFVVCVALERGYDVRRIIAEGHPEAVEGVDYFHLV